MTHAGLAAPLFAIAALLSSAAAAAQSVQITANDDATIQADRVMLRGLDTLNGTAKDLPVGIGEVVRYGHLEIVVDTCRVPQSDPTGDAYAYLRVRDIREDELRFSGWMFASSPALSALDHPRYDVWVQRCSSR